MTAYSATTAWDEQRVLDGAPGPYGMGASTLVIRLATNVTSLVALERQHLHMMCEAKGTDKGEAGLEREVPLRGLSMTCPGRRSGRP